MSCELDEFDEKFGGAAAEFEFEKIVFVSKHCSGTYRIGESDGALLHHRSSFNMPHFSASRATADQESDEVDRENRL